EKNPTTRARETLGYSIRSHLRTPFRRTTAAWAYSASKILGYQQRVTSPTIACPPFISSPSPPARGSLVFAAGRPTAVDKERAGPRMHDEMGLPASAATG